jgi:hypothetical protein
LLGPLLEMLVQPVPIDLQQVAHQRPAARPWQVGDPARSLGEGRHGGDRTAAARGARVDAPAAAV